MRALTLLLAGVMVQASPIVITTVITGQQYRTANMGGADPATFLNAFGGIVPGTPFKHFSLTQKGPNWIMSAEVDEFDAPPHHTPPYGPGGNPETPD
jgi:hypothetical protein